MTVLTRRQKALGSPGTRLSAEMVANQPEGEENWNVFRYTPAVAPNNIFSHL